MKSELLGLMVLLAMGLTMVSHGRAEGDGLKVGFYKDRCPSGVDVERIIREHVEFAFAVDPTIAPALLRLQFHDCFVHGCDASILIEGPSTEKTAPPNLNVRGYELIDVLKALVEERCPGIVSCADIIAIATRDIISLARGPEYEVETGRRDGKRSSAKDVNLPSPFMSVPQCVSAFNFKGFTSEEMVLLLGGGHSIGITHCAFFQDRLYNFNKTGQADPNMDPTLVKQLKQTCPKGATSNNFTNLNQNESNSNTVNNSLYSQLLNKRGILPIDQALALNPQTKVMVQRFTSEAEFSAKFVAAMVKLQALDVLTGNQGEIRRTCRRVH